MHILKLYSNKWDYVNMNKCKLNTNKVQEEQKKCKWIQMNTNGIRKEMQGKYNANTKEAFNINYKADADNIPIKE